MSRYINKGEIKDALEDSLWDPIKEAWGSWNLKQKIYIVSALLLHSAILIFIF